MAWLVLDEKRILARRHGLVPCLTLPRGRGDSEAGCCGAANPVLRLYSGLLGSRLYQVRARHRNPDLKLEMKVHTKVRNHGEGPF